MADINDVVIKIATVNGTGSASANGLLMKSIFRMGIPVVGKNYMYRRYGVPSATYEVGDETNRGAAQAAAVVFAEELMMLMLETLAPAG